MPRIGRIDIGGYVYHVLNRANARVQIFDDNNEEEALERSIAKDVPYGVDSWVGKIVKKFGLEQTLRGVGRPRKK